jgi:hypothetical protein
MKTLNYLTESIQSIILSPVSTRFEQVYEIQFKSSKDYIKMMNSDLFFTLVIKLEDNEFLVFEECEVTKTILQEIHFRTKRKHRFDLGEFRRFRIKNLDL